MDQEKQKQEQIELNAYKAKDKGYEKPRDERNLDDWKSCKNMKTRRIVEGKSQYEMKGNFYECAKCD